MAAYVIAQVEVTNPARYDDYRAGVPATVEAYGGRFVVRGGPYEVKEGDWDPKRVIVIEFPSAEQARAWYASPEYSKLIPIRQEAATASLLIVEGA